MLTVSVSEARASLSHLLDRVAAGDAVTITRHGRPIAVLVRPNATRPRRASPVLEVAANIHDALAAGRTGPLPAPGYGLDEARAEELIAEIRAGRGHP